ncbi:MAG: hypothetical protein ACK8QZ_05285 [Anaerolineales bacterium]
MEERKSYKFEYRVRTWAFSLSCIAVVLLGGFIAANNRAWGWNIENISAYLLTVGAIIIYLLKINVWCCPSCGHSFEMGTTRYNSMKSSSIDYCPKCHASFK